MIDWLIFSKDRPLQLDGLLTSFDLHGPELQRSVTILHTSSAPLYQLAYLDVAKAHRRQVFWRQSDSFEADVREWLAGQGYYVGFLCDDDVFIRGTPPVEAVRPRVDEVCFSLRLHYPGRNWHWRRTPELDYGYPFSLDGHVYRRSTILAVLDGLDFDDPTRLEAGMAARAETHAEANLIACDHLQSLVGIPANRVSATSGMPHMGIEPAELCERYLDGWRLDPNAMGLGSVETAHVEIPLAFRRIEATVGA